MEVIYDLGANRGDNLPYFLSRAQTVVAVEANPALVNIIAKKYAKAIRLGRLRIVHCALAENSADSIPFFINKKDDHVSALKIAGNRNSNDFDVANVPAMRVDDIVSDNGYPKYIKIDLEGFDSVVMRQLFSAGIFPDYLSAEAHTLTPFALMEEALCYKSYQILNARTFSSLPAQAVDSKLTGVEYFHFHEGTSGPFGSDIPMPWMSSRQCLLNLAVAGLGWRDIHARKQHPGHDARVYLESLPFRGLLGAIIRKSLPRSWKKQDCLM